MTVIRLRAVVSALAAAGWLVGLSAAGPELPWVALVCAVAAIVAQARWLPRLDVAAGLVVIAWLISAQLAPLPGATALPTLTCVLVVCGTARLPPFIARALLAGCLAIAVLILALVAAFGLASMGEARSATYAGLEGWGGYPEMGLIGVMALPVVLSLAVGPGPRQARAGAAVAVCSIAAGVVLSGSRAAWGAATLGSGLVLFTQRRGRWPSAFTLTAGAAVVALLVTMGLRLAGVSLEVASRSRVEAWGQAIELWRERPVSGWGPATYHRAYAARHHDQPTDAQFHAHSEYLHVAVETGLLGVASAIGFALTVLAGLRHDGRPRRTMAAAARIGLVCGLVAVAARFLVDYFDPAGAGMRVMLWLSILAGLRLALEPGPRLELLDP